MATRATDASSRSANSDTIRSLQSQIASVESQIASLDKIKNAKTRKTKAAQLNKKLGELQTKLNKAQGSGSGTKIESSIKVTAEKVPAIGKVTAEDVVADEDDRVNTVKKVLETDKNVKQYRKGSYYTNKSPDGKAYTYLDDRMSNYGKLIYHANNMFSEKELKIHSKTYRFGYFNTQSVSAGREFLFFTKPDLNIIDSKSKLLPYYNGLSFWQDLAKNRMRTIRTLQISQTSPKKDYFNHLLQNQCISGMDIPGLSASMIETPTNDYGVGYNYRGSSEASDDNPEFSLEFKDTKWLDVYTFFKAYEYYETMKHHGAVAPRSIYIENRVIHDQFAIYKFIVAEDMETIIYWGKMYGVCPKSLPRDAFSNATFDNGITFTVDFQAAFYEDMVPDILSDFNFLSKNYYKSKKYNINVYDQLLGMADGRPAQAAMVRAYKSSKSPTGYVYKLKWRGDDIA